MCCEQNFYWMISMAGISYHQTKFFNSRNGVNKLLHNRTHKVPKRIDYYSGMLSFFVTVFNVQLIIPFASEQLSYAFALKYMCPMTQRFEREKWVEKWKIKIAANERSSSLRSLGYILYNSMTMTTIIK